MGSELHKFMKLTVGEKGTGKEKLPINFLLKTRKKHPEPAHLFIGVQIPKSLKKLAQVKHVRNALIIQPFIFFFIFFLFTAAPHPQHMEVPRPGVESELELWHRQPWIRAASVT